MDAKYVSCALCFKFTYVDQHVFNKQERFLFDTECNWFYGETVEEGGGGGSMGQEGPRVGRREQDWALGERSGQEGTGVEREREIW